MADERENDRAIRPQAAEPDALARVADEARAGDGDVGIRERGQATPASAEAQGADALSWPPSLAVLACRLRDNGLRGGLTKTTPLRLHITSAIQRDVLACVAIVAGRAQIAHHRFDFLQRLAETQHQAGFGRYVRMLGLEALQQLQ